MEKVSKRVNAIQEVNESVSLLNQLLEGYSQESYSQSNQELIKVSTAQRIKTCFSKKKEKKKIVKGFNLFLISGFIPTLWKDEAHTVQISQWHRGQWRCSG